MKWRMRDYFVFWLGAVLFGVWWIVPPMAVFAIADHFLTGGQAFLASMVACAANYGLLRLLDRRADAWFEAHNLS